MKHLLALALFLAPALGFSLTLGDIKTQIRRNMRDTSSDTALQRYSTALLTDMANETQRDIINQTWAVESSTSITTVSGTIYYDLPSDYLATIKVTNRRGSNAPFELTEVSRKGLFASNPAWATTTGTPSQYYVRESTGETVAQFAVVPPVASSSTGTVVIDYYAMPADMDSDSDIPFDGRLWLTQYHDAFVYHVTGRLKMMEGKTDEANFYLTLYTSRVTLMKERLGSRPNFNPAVTVGSPR